MISYDDIKSGRAVAPVAVAPVAKEIGALPAMVKAAADKLASATTAAEVLDAKDAAVLVYDASKRAARVAKAKKAHDDLIAAAHRAQADALDIEAAAKRRLADEYDGGQERGEIAKAGGDRSKIPDGNNAPATTAEIGISSKEIHDARQIRDVIVANPTAVREALDDILAKGDEPTRAALRKAIAPAAKAVRALDQGEKKDRRATREIELAAKITALPGKRYGVIVADPEWRFEPYSRETGMDRAADNHYPTSALEEIKSRDVASIDADDCVLFLWATAPMLPQALEVLSAWGFTYKTHAIWYKQRTGDGRGTGYWFLGEHELLLVGTRGDVVAPAMGTQARSVFEAPVGLHSEKPEIALDIIERYFPNIPKIELNRRGPARSGWDAWGNEAETHSERSHHAARPSASTGNAPGEIPVSNPVANVGEGANGAIAAASSDPASRDADGADRQQPAASGFTGEGDGRGVEASGRTASVTTISPSAVPSCTVEGTAEPAVAQPQIPPATAEVSHPQPSSSPEADMAAEPQDRNEPVSGSAVSLTFRKTIADYRPFCQKPEACAGSGLKHCYACQKIADAHQSDAEASA